VRYPLFSSLVFRRAEQRGWPSVWVQWLARPRPNGMSDGPLLFPGCRPGRCRRSLAGHSSERGVSSARVTTHLRTTLRASPRGQKHPPSVLDTRTGGPWRRWKSRLSCRRIVSCTGWRVEYDQVTVGQGVELLVPDSGLRGWYWQAEGDGHAAPYLEGTLRARPSWGL